eukprot:CAMPEP_0195510880 /NCGR_PEP_ID=MMETSP0794_2-20130614/3392_1 /TAXON_ID=515487 /ORGANISM="Stephanopyxis turris, Strain CCMP 815" /LENGTH=434 /DNA_ID=CAMNT_0040638389 /DNA_START=33 /DNA_END=1337 /DNA_ORIENTATION=-
MHVHMKFLRGSSVCFVVLVGSHSVATNPHLRHGEDKNYQVKRRLNLGHYLDPRTVSVKKLGIVVADLPHGYLSQQPVANSQPADLPRSPAAIDGLPFCSLDGPDAKHSLAGGEWRITPNRPISNHLIGYLNHQSEIDPPDKERLERNSRLWYFPQNCKLHPWSSKGFKKCLDGRRLIFVGDDTTIQMTGSIMSLLNQRQNYNTYDKPMREHANMRYTIDPHSSWDKVGPSIHARSYYATTDSIEADPHPSKVSASSWNMMVEDFGGWQEGDVLVVNYGAHYLSPRGAKNWGPHYATPEGKEDLRSSLEPLFTEILPSIPSDKVTIFWLEYSPAHFGITPDGEFPADQTMMKVPEQRTCAPHQTKMPSIVNTIAMESLQKCGVERCGHIRILPIWDMMVDAWDQHMESSMCRHYTTPGPYEVWDNLLYHELCFDG